MMAASAAGGAPARIDDERQVPAAVDKFEGALEAALEIEWQWPDEAACAASAQALARRPALANATIELHGPLGAGKTTFVRHLLRALGVAGRIKSPTYTVVEPYRADAVAGKGTFGIAHFDFYRFADEREFVDAGLREMFAAPGLKLVEWASRARGLLPQPDLALTIEPQPDDSRRVVVQANTPRGVELVR